LSIFQFAIYLVVTCISSHAAALSVDNVGSVALSEVGVAEDKATDGNGPHDCVRPDQSHKVVGQVIHGSIVLLRLVVTSRWFILIFLFVIPSQDVVGRVAEGEAGDPCPSANDHTKGQVLESLRHCNGLAGELHGLVSFPEESALDVSGDGDTDRPGDEHEDDEEFPEAPEVEG
jgi:hypothetical protein